MLSWHMKHILIFFSSGSRRSRKETPGVLLCSCYGCAFTLALPRGVHVAADPGDTNGHNDCCLRLHLLGDLACYAKALWHDQRPGVSMKLIPFDMQSYFHRSTNSETAEGRMLDVKGDDHSHTLVHKEREKHLLILLTFCQRMVCISLEAFATTELNEIFWGRQSRQDVKVFRRFGN